MVGHNHMAEDALSQDFESMCVSKKLVRSVSRKLRRRRINGSAGDEEETGLWLSLRCLTLYGRGGGCKVGADTIEDFEDSSGRRRSSAGEEGKGYKNICGADETGVDCFAYGRKDRIRKKSNRKNSELYQPHSSSRIDMALPDDILEMCLMRLPFSSLMNARLVCKKWNLLTSTPRFMQIRRESSYLTPWLFVFGVAKDGISSGEIHAVDVALNQSHTISAEVLKGRSMFSVTSFRDEIFIVGGCSSLTSSGRMDRSSFKTHKSMLVLCPCTKSWRKVTSMKYARSSPVLGICEVSRERSINYSQSTRQDKRVSRSRLAGISDVYEDPHRLSVRRQPRSSSEENADFLTPLKKQCRPLRLRSENSTLRDCKRFVLIAIGGLGSWDEPLDSGEMYDSVSNKWIEIPKLPLDFGVVCSGVVCSGTFFVYSESDKLAGYDIERGHWVVMQNTTLSPPRVHEYYPKLVTCSDRLFMLSVSWCEGDGEIGRRNKAIRKMWELDLTCLTWTEVSTHPDAPMDWNAAFVADGNFIFGVEMFKIFGQVLDFFTMCEISDKAIKWNHIAKNQVTHELDASSCMRKTVVALHL